MADFGLSCVLMDGADDNNLTAETGTYRWMAPEIIRHEAYSFPADVYSFGVIFWELVARTRPYAGLTAIQAAFGVAKDGLRPLIPPSTPLKVKSLIQRCWHQNPAMRPTFAELVDLIPQLL